MGHHLNSIGRAIAIAWLLLTLAGISFAQDHPHKSAATGRLISLGTTVTPLIIGSVLIGSGDENDDDGTLAAGWIINLSAMTFGPGAGHLYADQSGRFVGGSAIRALCITASLTAAAVGIASTFDFDDDEDDDDIGAASAVVMVGGALAWLGYSIYDIARIGKSVDEYNARQDQVLFSASPYYQPQDKAVGLALSIRF
ncbi:MAG: hypothetical protein RBT76_01610 [candidate division Zixibacteria bacterium]|jgi:hypothetical protein|nr:hypothetical protein [candidate division Zixibacteria bacterium]